MTSSGPAHRASVLARGLTASGILRIAAEVRELAATGVPICNLTVGDFAPSEFRIPAFLADAIADAVRSGETHYPPAAGVPALREAVRALCERDLGLSYPTASVIVSAGGRPIIYGTYRTVVDPGDRVVFPVPSWNNEYYCHLVGAKAVPVVCGADTAFLPTAAMLRDHLRGARLLVLNSPMNPAGTAFDESTLGEICDLVLEENARRGSRERPLYVLYDQVYWMLTFGETRHVTPPGVRPEMSRYTIIADAASKPFAATGIRVGWGLGPADIMGHVSDVVAHIGAWAPRAEQVAVARLLNDKTALDEFIVRMRSDVRLRLQSMHDGLAALAAEGLPVEVLPPAGAIYLSAKFDASGLDSTDATRLRTDDDVRRHLLHRAGVAVIPFEVFGVPGPNGWFRLSAGAVSRQQIEEMMPRLRDALSRGAVTV